MTRNLLRAGALSCALLTTTAFCTQPAIAQTAQQFRNLDANGVDLTHGDSVLSFTEATIGSGPAALTLDRVRGGMRSTSSWDLIALRRTVNADGTLDINIERGAVGERFTGTSGALTPRNGDGATLTGGGDSYVHRARDGTLTMFGIPGALEEGSSSSFCSSEQANETTCTLVPLSITSPDGRQVHLEYDLVAKRLNNELPVTWVYNYRLARVWNSFGYSIAFTYVTAEAFGIPPSSWFERNGAVLRNDTLEAPVVGSVSYAAVSGTSAVAITDAAGRVWQVNGTTSAITNIRRPGAAADDLSVVLNGGQVTSVTKSGVTTSYARTVSGNIATTTITNALIGPTVVESDLTIGRPTKVTQAGRTILYQYDGFGRLTRTTAPEGNYTQFTYGARGKLTETRHVAKPNTGLADIVTTASYDAACANPVTCNQPNSVTDARGNVTDYTYDAAHGGVTSVTAPAATGGAARAQTRYAYTLVSDEYRLTSISACSSGTAPACVGTAAESRTLIGYDTQGNVTSVEQRDGAETLSATQTATYDGIGNQLAVDGPLAGTADTIRYRYNGARQVVGTIGPDPDGAGILKHRAVRTNYRSDGLAASHEVGTVNSQSDGDWAEMAVLQAVQAEYDANGRPVVQRLVSGGTTYSLTQTSYDALGRPECTAQRMNTAKFGSLPSSACTLDDVGTFGPDRIVKNSYDAAGQVILVQSGYGVTGVQADEVATTYRSNGQVETMTDGEGNRTTYSYDGHNRLKQTRYPVATRGANASSTSDYEELGYDPAGNVTSRRVRDGQVIGYSYDALNRLTLENSPNDTPWPDDRSYGYDLLGRMILARYDGANLDTVIAYDALGRKLSEGNAAHGTTSFQYDEAGRRTRMTWKDGFYVTYDYLTTGEMTHVRENGATSGVGVLATFAYDNHGRRTSLTRGNGTVTAYGYDAVSRMDGLVQNLAGDSNDLTLGFSHNPAGQIATNTRSNDAYSFTALANQNVTDTHNGLNQITTTGVWGIIHDGRGNVTNDSTRTFTYMADNRLERVNGVDAAYHDGLKRLYWINEPISFAYDGQAMIAELTYTTNHPIARRYVHGPGMDEPLVQYEGTGTNDRKFLHADERGSIVAQSDSSGAVTAVNRYDEYGRPDSGNTGRFGYVPEPVPGVVRLGPGESAAAGFGLGARFQATGRGSALPPGWAAELTIRYGDCRDRPHCDPRYGGGDCRDSGSRRARSGWQLIS